MNTALAATPGSIQSMLNPLLTKLDRVAPKQRLEDIGKR